MSPRLPVALVSSLSGSTHVHTAFYLVKVYKSSHKWFGSTLWPLEKNFRKWVIPPKRLNFAKWYSRDLWAKKKLRRSTESFTKRAIAIPSSRKTDYPFRFFPKESLFAKKVDWQHSRLSQFRDSLLWTGGISFLLDWNSIPNVDYSSIEWKLADVPLHGYDVSSYSRRAKTFQTLLVRSFHNWDTI